MPVIEFSIKDLCSLIGQDVPIDVLKEKIPQIGADIEKVEGDKISVEFFPNRPDLYSVEGIARALRTFLFSPGLRRYIVEKSDCVMNVQPSVKPIRPYIAFAMVKDLTITDDIISSMMNLQEKLHLTVGRNRAKVAIGIHDADAVQPPFTYRAAEPSEGFVPLGMEEWMSLSDILQRHEKGIECAWVLKGLGYPLIVDKNNNVLSFPPIINGALTAVTPRTRNILVDVTGTDPKAVELCLNIVVTALAERGGRIYAVDVVDKERISYPRLEGRRMKVSLKYVQRIMGMALSTEEVCHSLEKMGYEAKPLDKNIEVQIPAYRGDVLHQIDVVEDVAIGYCYDKLTPVLPEEPSFGMELPVEKKSAIARQIMIGLGYQEVMSFVLSDSKYQEGFVEIENPITEEYAILRTTLVPSLMQLLRANRHRPLPQKIFEIGDAIDRDYRNIRKVCGLRISARTNFTEIKSDVEALMRTLGVNYSIVQKDLKPFIPGRCGALIVNQKEKGYFGELSPDFITSFELGYPVTGFELIL